MKRQIFQCRPWQRQTLQIRIIIQCIYSRYIWKRHISSIMWIYVDDTCIYMWISDIRLQYTQWTSACDIPTESNPENTRRHCVFHMVKETAAKAMARPLDHSTRIKEHDDNMTTNPFNIFSFCVALVSMPFRLANTRRLGTNFMTKQDCLHLIYEVVHLPERATVPGMALTSNIIESSNWWNTDRQSSPSSWRLCEKFSLKAA